MPIRKRPPWPRDPQKPDVLADTEGLCNVTRAAAFLDVHIRTVQTLVKRGELESVKIGSARRIKWESLRRYAGVPAPTSIQVRVDPATMHDMVEDIVRAVVRQTQSTRK